MRGWIGIELDNVGDEDLAFHIRDGLATGGAKLQAVVDNPAAESKPSDRRGYTGLSERCWYATGPHSTLNPNMR